VIKKMEIKFEKGKKIIKHPAGVISVYTVESLKMLLDSLVKQAERIEAQIKDVQADIQKMV